MYNLQVHFLQSSTTRSQEEQLGAQGHQERRLPMQVQVGPALDRHLCRILKVLLGSSRLVKEKDPGLGMGTHQEGEEGMGEVETEVVESNMYRHSLRLSLVGRFVRSLSCPRCR